MFDAYNVSDADIGGHGFSKQYPFVLRISPGRDDYIITLVGEAEKAKILADSKDLLDELCSLSQTRHFAANIFLVNPRQKRGATPSY